MTDSELDQLLNRWQPPAASPLLRERVLEKFPRRERRGFGRPLAWSAAMALVLCMIAIGTAQSGHGTLENFATGLRHFSENVTQFVDQLWAAHVLAAFRGSHLKIYMDGQFAPDAEYGGGGSSMWVRLGLGSVSMLAGRFDGHVLEFQAGGRAVRIESSGTYGSGMERPVYVLGPRLDR